MNRRYRIGAFWAPRPESTESCASRLSALLIRLQAYPPPLSRWYPKAYTREDALSASQLTGNDLHSIYSMMEEGRNCRDDNGEPIEELGFHISLWNHQEDERGASLDVVCGCYSEIFAYPNRVLLTVPAQREPEGIHLAQIVTAFVEAWEPDWAALYSAEAWERRDRRSGLPVVDGIVYVSEARYRLGSVPMGCRAERLHGRGTLLILDENLSRKPDTGHDELITRVTSAIQLRETPELGKSRPGWLSFWTRK